MAPDGESRLTGRSKRRSPVGGKFHQRSSTLIQGSVRRLNVGFFMLNSQRASALGLEGSLVHPRTPGEKTLTGGLIEDFGGPLPYAGGKHGNRHCGRRCGRSTPACRGKTRKHAGSSRRLAVHPAPGEKPGPLQPHTIGTGPPRTLGENNKLMTRIWAIAVHPRTPGENIDVYHPQDPNHGPPPHTGGKRPLWRRPCNPRWSHPRAGGKRLHLHPAVGQARSTPHPGGKRGHTKRRHPTRRSTPARGKTDSARAAERPLAVHPRARGENGAIPNGGVLPDGPPPHAGENCVEGDYVMLPTDPPRRRGKTAA